ncbi:MAG: lectin-like protein [Planctomycetota bacterium]|nr:lectin-like protein [Planctomycetota bacterium]MCZ6652268.1 lectin-like protein [Planctomycetota bacterium]
MPKRVSLWAIALAALCVAPAGDAAPIQWTSASGGNDHYYEDFDASLDWFGADAAAGSMVFMGFTGHLATVTSLPEHEFLISTFADRDFGLWLGGIQAPGSTEPGGGWGWITGEPFAFTIWNPSEPNNAQGEEERIELRSEGAFRGWNDQFSLDTNSGYIVEWEPGASVPEPYDPRPLQRCSDRTGVAAEDRLVLAAEAIRPLTWTDAALFCVVGAEVIEAAAGPGTRH